MAGGANAGGETGFRAEAEELADARYALTVPAPSLPLLSPLLSVVPGQVFARSLALARGLDPDSPRGLSKVTLAL